MAGVRRQPLGKSLHIHQLDGGRLEAMVHLDPEGARVTWEHGKGDCAITGEGEAILEVLMGSLDAEAAAAAGRLVLYGDLELVRAAPRVFRP